MFKRVLFSLLLVSLYTFSQESDIYRGEETKVHDLVHTKLKVSFDYAKRELHGEEWLTAKPHFYPTQQLTLDAKSMIIHEVKMADKKLDYNYDGNELIIDLNNMYSRGETFHIYIKYTARPEMVEQAGSAAITDAKGLYFIDPDDTDPDKPTQIWTQGETESSSCWFPTIDSPNQKTTQEMYITVPEQYTTLSNGLKISETPHADGTRTDYWKMSQPHAPYLFFMGIGDYAVVKDSWNGIPVNYYVEKDYEDEAMDIFGHTPEMIEFFSNKFGVKYPWEKYSQIIGRDYVSGAMENTTSTLHGEMANQKKGQLIDENTWEDVISHELSHHWFGDLVTTESWSNLTVNESFATYSEYLWREYKYGKEHADAHLYDDKQTYLTGGNEKKNLVRFHYAEREDMFDGVSYQKGGVILHMLRKEVGDGAFFAGLQHYLKQHEYGTAEAHQFRISMEEICGKDLNPFFNQWYYANGHPKLWVSYDIDERDNTVTLNLKQGDKVFHFPLKIDVYESGKRIEHHVDVTKKEHNFTFRYNETPDLVNVNADHILLCELNDDKTLEQYIFQYNHAPHFEDRLQAIEYLYKKQDDEKAFKTLTKALNDPYYNLRIKALKNIDLAKKGRKNAIPIIEKLATSDPKTKVQGAAMGVLAKLLNPEYKSIFMKGMISPSYSVKSNSTIGLYYIDRDMALEGMNKFDEETKQDLAPLLVQIYVAENDDSQMVFIAKNLLSLLFSNDVSKEQQKRFAEAYQWIASSNNLQAIQGFTKDCVSKGKRYKRYGVDAMAMGLLNNVINMQEKNNNSNKEAIILEVKKGIAQLVE
jgi:aminopeptidase N